MIQSNYDQLNKVHSYDENLALVAMYIKGKNSENNKSGKSLSWDYLAKLVRLPFNRLRYLVVLY